MVPASPKRCQLQVALPPGYCWDELGRIVMDPDERVVKAIRLVFRKFREPVRFYCGPIRPR